MTHASGGWGVKKRREGRPNEATCQANGARGLSAGQGGWGKKELGKKAKTQSKNSGLVAVKGRRKEFS